MGARKLKHTSGPQKQYDVESVHCQVKDVPARIIDPAGRITYLNYDLKQRLTSKKDANGGLTRYEYYDNGDLLALTDADNNRTVFYYDANRRLVRRERPSIMPGANGKTIAATEVTQWKFDAAGRTLREEKVSAGSPNTILATTMSYDDLDHVIEKKLTREVNGTVTELQDDSTFAFARQLDSALQLSANNEVEQLGFVHEAVPPFAMTSYSIKATDPTNALGLIQDTYTLTPDVTGEIGAITNSDSLGIWSAGYDPAGRLSQIASGNFIPTHSLTSTVTLDSFARKRGVVHSTGMIGSFSYDLLNRITDLTWTGLDGTGASQNFSEKPTYDPLTGNITELTREFGSFSYGFDKLDQLTSSKYTGHTALGAAANRSDQFDWTGNRSTDSIDGPGSFLANFETGNANSSYFADADGFGELAEDLSRTTNDLSTFAYRADERLSSFLQRIDERRDSAHTAAKPIVTQVQYFTDALGRRVAKQVELNPVNEHQCSLHKHQSSSFTQSYVYLADQDKILLSKSGTGLVTEYLDGLGIDEHLGEVSSSGEKGYVADHLGSVFNSPAAGGAPAYSAWGEQLGIAPVPSVSSDPTAYGFAGRQLDFESGQYYYRARQYSPGTGRFLSSDSLGFAGGDKNLYRYVFNRPLIFSDPTGETCVYIQSTGQFTCSNGTGSPYLNTTGYSGASPSINNPGSQNIPNGGVIPVGTYGVGSPGKTTSGVPGLPLIPDPSNTCPPGRNCGSFFIHGGQPGHSASTGCIIINNPTRGGIPTGETITVVP